MEEEQVKLFVDLFNEEERIGRLKKRVPIWKWIVVLFDKINEFYRLFTWK